MKRRQSASAMAVILSVLAGTILAATGRVAEAYPPNTRPLLDQPAAPQVIIATQSAWWTDSAAGWIGGIVGSLVGCMGGLIGTLAGMGKARRFVLAALLAMAIGGAIVLVTGIIAVTMGQPYAVYYPLLLLGGITLVVGGSIRPGVRRAYEARELARMKALDG